MDFSACPVSVPDPPMQIRLPPSLPVLMKVIPKQLGKPEHWESSLTSPSPSCLPSE